MKKKNLPAEKSSAEKRMINDLRKAESKRNIQKPLTVGVYVSRLTNGFYGAPFVAVSDDIASSSFRSLIDDSKESCLVGCDLFRIGSYHLDSGKLSACTHKYLPY